MFMSLFVMMVAPALIIWLYPRDRMKASR
jgi:hypothetical protein